MQMCRAADRKAGKYGLVVQPVILERITMVCSQQDQRTPKHPKRAALSKASEKMFRSDRLPNDIGGEIAVLCLATQIAHLMDHICYVRNN